jgi:quercetin dioxygenase-like cupin family protein
LATLSRIENGKGTGTFRTHQRIADALEVPLPELYRGLADPESEATLIEPASEEAETFTYDEKTSATLLTRQVTAKQMLPQMLILQPEGKTSQEQYAPGTERWLFGLEGTLEVTVGQKLYPIPAGGTLYFKASLPHQLYNPGADIARVISVTSPAVL